MPDATVGKTSIVRRELKSLEGAWVDVQPLPHGLMLQRRDQITKTWMEANPEANRATRRANMGRMHIDVMNEIATLFDYKHCIVDHNLQDAEGNKLDLGNPLTLQILSPKVGAELDEIISELNDFEEDEDFIQRLSGVSQGEQKESQIQNSQVDSENPTNTSTT